MFEDVYGLSDNVDSVDSPVGGGGASYATIAPDASGGSGSLSSAFASIALNGLSKSVDGYTSKKFPLGFYAQQYDVNADGTVTPRAAVTPSTFGAQLRAAATSPAALYIGGAAAVVLIILMLRKH
jgi:hypothetical protein